MAEWPNYPRNLSEAFCGKKCPGIANCKDDDENSLVKIPRLMLLGAAQSLEMRFEEKGKVPVTIYELRAIKDDEYIYTSSFLKDGHCVEFCQSIDDFHSLTNDRGDELTLRKSNIIRNECLKSYKIKAEEYLKLKLNEAIIGECSFGLQSIYCGIMVSNRMVGVLVAGRFIKYGDKDNTKKKLYELCKEKQINIDEDMSTALDKYLESILEYDKQKVDDMMTEVKKIAKLVETMAESRYRARLADKEKNFLRDIGRQIFKDKIPDNYNAFRCRIADVLLRIRIYCGFNHIIFFGSNGVDDNVLDVMAHSGVDSDNLNVHFNWKRASLGKNFVPDGQKEFESSFLEKVKRGIRGKDKDRLNDILYIVPFRYTNGYKGAMVLGSTIYPIEKELEHSFFHRLCHTTGLRILGQYALLSLRSRKVCDKRQVEILGHTMLNAFTKIVYSSHHIYELLNDMIQSNIKNEIRESVDLIFSESSLVETFARKLLKNNIYSHGVFNERFEMLKEMCTFTMYSLSAIIYNCIERYNIKANNKYVFIETEGIDDLPLLKLDRALIDVAISNIIDNAIKYSATDETIYIKCECNINNILLQICDRGYGIDKENIEKIFSIEYRSIYRNPISQIESYGLGLLLAKSIIDSHGGKIWCTSDRIYDDESTPGADHLTRFIISLPID